MTDHAISIDPGKRHCGVAVWERSRHKLVCAGLVKNPSKARDDLMLCVEMSRAVVRWHAGMFQRAAHITQLVAERPQVYTVGKQRKAGEDGEVRWTDPNDLPPLMGVDTGIACLCGPECVAVSYLPREWKGTMPKAAMNARALSRLSHEEMCMVSCERDLTDHNVLDAIGIGLHHLGRLERVRVFPGST